MSQVLGRLLGVVRVAVSTRMRFLHLSPAAPAGAAVRAGVGKGGGVMLRETGDPEEIIERVAAWDVGKGRVVCCVRVVGPQ